MSCCPIEVSEFKESKAIPNNASNDSKQAGKAMRPLALKSDKSKQHIKEQCGPELPAYGMLGVSEEVADFEGLLDLFEEDFDTPAAAIQIADTGSGPLEVIRQEGHDRPFAVDLDPCGDTAQTPGILLAGLVGNQSDLVITDDVTIGFFQSLTANPAPQVILGSGHPEDAPITQIEEIGEVDVGLVEDRDLSGLKPGAQRHGAGVVMMGGFFDDRKSRKESLQVQPQMHLSGGLAAAVLGPVHAIGHQCDSRRINGMDRAFESTGQPVVAARGPEPRAERLKMSENTPKQFLHHVAVAVSVGVRERVAAWCHCPTDRSKLASVVSKAVADIVQPNRVRQLRKQKTDNVAPRSEGAGLLVHAMLAGKFFRQVRRDEFTKLMQCAAVVLGRRYFFHTSDSLVGIRRRPTFFIPA